MQPAAGISEPLHQEPLDEAVNVFVRTIDKRRVRAPALENVCERRLNLPALVTRENTGTLQRPRPRDAPGHVVFEQAAIEAERGAPFKGRRVGCVFKAPGPEGRHLATSDRF